MAGGKQGVICSCVLTGVLTALVAVVLGVMLGGGGGKSAATLAALEIPISHEINGQLVPFHDGDVVKRPLSFDETVLARHNEMRKRAGLQTCVLFHSDARGPWREGYPAAGFFGGSGTQTLMYMHRCGAEQSEETVLHFTYSPSLPDIVVPTTRLLAGYPVTVELQYEGDVTASLEVGSITTPIRADAETETFVTRASWNTTRKTGAKTVLKYTFLFLKGDVTLRGYGADGKMNERVLHLASPRFTTAAGCLAIPSDVQYLSPAILGASKDAASLCLHGGIKQIAAGTFDGFQTLLTIATNGAPYSFSEGILYTSNGTTLHTYLQTNKDPTFTLPQTVDVVQTHAFYGQQHLATLELAKLTVLFQPSAFEGCALAITHPTDVPRLFLSVDGRELAPDAVITDEDFEEGWLTIDVRKTGFSFGRTSMEARLSVRVERDGHVSTGSFVVGASEQGPITCTAQLLYDDTASFVPLSLPVVLSVERETPEEAEEGAAD